MKGLLMRTRTRNTSYSTSYPGYSTESFTDDVDHPRSRAWKECSSEQFQVLAASRVHASLGTVFGGSVSDDKGARENFNVENILYGAYNGVLPESSLKLPAIDLAEMRITQNRCSTNLAETVATVRDSLLLFSRPYAFVKHMSEKGRIATRDAGGSLRNLRSAIDAAGSTWLAGTYGYLPFLSDLVALADIAGNPRDVLFNLAQKPKRTVTNQFVEQTDVSSFGSSPTAPIGRKFTRVTSLRRKVYVDWVNNPDLPVMGVANTMATYLGLNDFGRLAWELVPFSFVADWFTNLGTTVAGASALNGPMFFLTGAVSTATEQITVTRASLVSLTTIKLSFPYTSMSLTGGSYVTRRRSYARSGWGKGDVDTLYGSLIDGISVYRAASGLALLNGNASTLLRWLHGKK